MEVADQWRREWAGTAEYGKVTEGGVTRRIARAMEVLHASGPGARVRVLRAAYHSSAGPGVPASSYMLHSSRRVITSGFNFMDPSSLPSTPNKPLEISSTSLDSSPDSHTETENYKVTEPDDLEISEPSKWRGASGIHSIRMPSEESSSADNASIIDLDMRANKGLHRKYSYDSESSDVQWNKKHSPGTSPFLDAPVSLNTLKYKSLLNSSSEWNNRRKSYSFEDTSPMSDANPFKNEIIAMESSTDSGICKSSEVVNDTDDNSYSRAFDQNEKKTYIQDESFQEWLSKNRLNSSYKGTKFKPHREHETVLEHPSESKRDDNIIIQSAGKVSITLPTSLSTEADDSHNKKVKKVEFCKTELHVAVDTGEVNIISTDDKPPPSNDFRKRRSVFVPMLDVPEKSITLFGDKFNDLSESIQIGDMLKRNNGEFGEIDENTAATKSILKNKIPKPKPYLLGENMAFGSSNMSNEERFHENSPVITAVSLINKQLQAQRRHSDEITSNLMEQTDSCIRKISTFRTIDEGPNKDKFDTEDVSRHILMKSDQNSYDTVKVNHVNVTKDKFYALQTSPVQNRAKTRQLRQSELSYFGVHNHREKSRDLTGNSDTKILPDDSTIEDIFNSVKLVKKISNSVCSSEAESEDVPQYQNVPLNTTYTPVPTPRLHSKHNTKPNKVEPAQKVKSIAEKDREGSTEISVPVAITRRPRLRKHEERVNHPNRSLSEPPKGHKYNSIDRTHPPQNQCTRLTKHAEKSGKDQIHKLNATKVSPRFSKKIPGESIPIYVNLDDGIDNIYQDPENKSPTNRKILRDSMNKLLPKKACHQAGSPNHQSRISNENDYAEIERLSDNENNNCKKTRRSNNNNESLQKLVNVDQPRFSKDCSREAEKRLTIQSLNKTRQDKKSDEDSTTKNKRGHRKLSSQRIKDNTKREEVSSKNNGHISRIDNKVVTLKADKSTRYKNELNEKNTLKNEPRQDKHKGDHDNASATFPQIKYDTKRSSHTNSNTKSDGYKTSRRNEYVIKYDDKKGTVSSVCKIKTGPGGIKTKKISSQIIDETPKETVVRHKAINKIALRK